MGAGRAGCRARPGTCGRVSDEVGVGSDAPVAGSEGAGGPWRRRGWCAGRLRPAPGSPALGFSPPPNPRPPRSMTRGYSLEFLPARAARHNRAMGTTRDLLTLGSFLLALGAGFHHLGSGRAARGLLVVACAFGALDFALVRGFIHQIQDLWTGAAVVALHAIALWELASLLRLAWRRRRPAWRTQRARLFGQAGEHFAAGRFAAALRPLARAGRGDPWDPAPRVWRGFCLLELGRAGGARSAFRRARALDRKGEWEHALRLGLGRLAGRSGRVKTRGA